LAELERAKRAVRAALDAGADEAEAIISIAKRFSTEARDRTIAKLEQSTARSMTLRVFVSHGKATLATSDLRDDAIGAFASAVVDAARFVAPDPYVGLGEGGAVVAEDLGIDDPAIARRDGALKLDEALELERAIRAFDRHITNSSGSRIYDATVNVFYANSRGMEHGYRGTANSASTSPIALDGSTKRVASYGSASRTLAGREPIERIATIAARRAVEQRGSRKPATMRAPVIFDRDVAAAVLGDLFAAVSAANVASKNSFLISKIGERVGSDLVTIIDDGRLYSGMGTSPIDAEGTPTRRTVVFNQGVLETYLYDTYYARKLGAATTANSSGGSVGPNNFYLLAGSRSYDELIASTQRGVLVLDTIGFSHESATGVYSRGARGFMIENGELAYPIEEFTIASNLVEMLAGIDLVADDLRFDSAITAPSFRVAEMTISGL